MCPGSRMRDTSTGGPAGGRAALPGLKSSANTSPAPCFAQKHEQAAINAENMADPALGQIPAQGGVVSGYCTLPGPATVSACQVGVPLMAQ